MMYVVFPGPTDDAGDGEGMGEAARDRLAGRERDSVPIPHDWDGSGAGF